MSIDVVSWLNLRVSHQHSDSNAPSQGEADVLLRSVSELRRAERLLPGRQVQQEQHRAARQVVQQLPVSTSCPVAVLEFVCRFQQRDLQFV